MDDHDRASEAEARRRAATAALQQSTGIDEDMIRRLVHGFYDRVRADATLGPVFATRIADWGPHLERMCAFWSSVMLATGRYNGRPMQQHAPLPIEAAHFDRWLAMFEATAHDLCPPYAARLFVERARMIGDSLEKGIAMFRGQAPGTRLS